MISPRDASPLLTPLVLAVVCVTYGYNEGQDPRTLPCDALLDTLADLPGMLLGN